MADIIRGRKDVSEVERDLIDLESELGTLSLVPIQTEQLDIYVSIANGDDENDGLSPSTPLKTYVATPFSGQPITNIPSAGNYETEAGINVGGPSLVFRISSSL